MWKVNNSTQWKLGQDRNKENKDILAFYGNETTAYRMQWKQWEEEKFIALSIYIKENEVILY